MNGVLELFSIDKKKGFNYTINTMFLGTYFMNILFKSKKISISFILILTSISIGIIIMELLARNLIGLGDPIVYETDPIVGFRLKANQDKKRRKGSRVTVDKEGFRVNPGSKINQNKYSQNVIFIGDSVTYGGSYIDNSELFSSIICKNLNYNLCLNGGVNAWGTGNMGRFISKIDLYTYRNINKLIVTILPGDELRNIQPIRGLGKWSGGIPRQPSALNEILKYILEIHLIPSLTNNSLKLEQAKSKEIRLRNISREINWNELISKFKKSEIPLFIVITPPRSWIENNQKFSSDIKFYNEYLKKSANLSNVVSTCNLINYLPKSKRFKDWYVDEVHLSKKGHSVWAKSIEKCLKL